jgi:hypothetical protein
MPWLLAAWAPALVALFLLPAGARATGYPLSFFTRDVFSLAEIPVYAGLLSNAGILLWCSTAAISLFTALVIAHASEARRFFLGFGLLSVLLMMDDFFMLHEWIVPRFLGLPEYVASGAYGLVTAALLIAARREIRLREPALLGVALVLFAASVTMDVLERPPAPAWHYLIEEGFKLLGVVTWFVYFARACVSEARGRSSAGVAAK